MPLPQAVPAVPARPAPQSPPQENANPEVFLGGSSANEPTERPPEPSRENQARFDEKHFQMLGKMLEGIGDRLEFGILEASGQMFVRVVDRSTNQVVKLRPAREFLEMKERLATALGLIVDERR